MQIKILNKSNHKLPNYETLSSAGMDLRASVSAPITLKPMDRAIIKTGLFIELPVGYEAQVRPRSGLAAKYGVTVLNSPGTIDSDYRGEVKVILINHSSEPFIIKNGDRIAQAVIASCTAKSMIKLDEVSELNDDTERGTGGFGSTGVN